MPAQLISVFVVAYLAIAFEHVIRVNKTASALLGGVLCWALYAFGAESTAVSEELSHHLGQIAEILFFLLGAMAIVELVDAYDGFRVVTERIRTTNRVVLLWLVCWLAFFLSAILDNLTTTIVMVSLLRRLVADPRERLGFVAMVVVAANAGGAWTPIGDVTTTMLWINGRITTLETILSLLLPSIVCLLVPLLCLTFVTSRSPLPPAAPASTTRVRGSALMLCLGVAGLLMVPVFKAATGLAPYLGMLLSLGLIWLVADLVDPHKDTDTPSPFSAVAALQRIDTPSVLFFLGVLLAVGALESIGVLHALSGWLDHTFHRPELIITLMGLLSAVVDNVPLVAAAMGMYDVTQYPVDSLMWQYTAYCAGTGGSILIIGSAAGVVAMGMERINFFWYLRRIAPLAAVGYFAGAVTYLLLN